MLDRIFFLLLLLNWSECKKSILIHKFNDYDSMSIGWNLTVPESIGHDSEYEIINAIRATHDPAVLYGDSYAWFGYGNLRIVVAVRNGSLLELIYINVDKIIYNPEIKDFEEEKILKVEVKWFVDRIYVLTRSKTNIIKLYEIDLHYKLIALLCEVKNNREDDVFQLSSNPLKGYVAFSIGNEILFTNINYFQYSEVHVFTDYTKGIYAMSNTSVSRQAFKCKITSIENIKFLLSELNITENGQSTIVLGDKWSGRCEYKGREECACKAVNKKTNSKLKTAYEQSVKIKKLTSTFYVPPNAASKEFQDKKLQMCLRSCSIYADNEMEYKKNVQRSFSNTRYDNQCFSYPDGGNRDVSLYYSKLITEVTIRYNNPQLAGCNEIINSIFDFKYKFIIFKKKLKNINDVGIDWKTEPFQSEEHVVYQDSSLLPDVTFNLSINGTSLLELYMQTPFETPKRLETFVVNSSQIAEYLNEKFQIPIKCRIPDLENDFTIRHDSIQFEIRFPTIVKNIKIDDYGYWLYNTKTNESVMVNLETNGYDLLTESVSLAIKNLTENTKYQLRIYHSTSKRFFSFQNLITFTTLQLPIVKVTNVLKDEITIEATNKCIYQLVDHDTVYDVNYPQSVNDPIICKELIFKYKLSNKKGNWSNETIVMINPPPFNKYPAFEYKNRYFLDEIPDLVSTYTIKNLKENEVYDINIELKYHDDHTWETIKKVKTYSKNFLIENNIVIWTIIPFSIIAIIIVTCILLFYYQVCDLRNTKDTLYKYMNINPMRNNPFYDPDYKKMEVVSKGLKEIKEEQLCLIKKIGVGHFGEVYKGMMKNESQDDVKITVAVKELRKEFVGQSDDLIREAIVSMNLKHKNLIQLYGICFSGNSPKYIVLEYADLGDLLTLLRGYRCKKLVTYKSALEICIDIAEGCEFLEQHNIVHRDLAARNCLVSSANNEGKIIVKVGDFGLARKVYEADGYLNHGNRPLPKRWMSPESLLDGISKTQSDVWSFGIVVWEILTMGKQPFPGLENNEVVDYIKNGGVPNVSPTCPTELKDLMCNCWKMRSSERPTFQTIVQNLKTAYNQNEEVKWRRYSNVVPMFTDLYSSTCSSDRTSERAFPRKSLDDDNTSGIMSLTINTTFLNSSLSSSVFTSRLNSTISSDLTESIIYNVDDITSGSEPQSPLK